MSPALRDVSLSRDSLPPLYRFVILSGLELIQWRLKKLSHDTRDSATSEGDVESNDYHKNLLADFEKNIYHNYLSLNTKKTQLSLELL